MIDRGHELPLVRQAVLIGLSRGAIHYEPRPIPDEDLKLMRRIDELHLELPFAGSRMLRDMLNAEGHAVGRRHVATLMKRMGIEAILSQEEHEPARSLAPRVSVSAAQTEHRSSESGLGGRLQCAAASGVGDERCSYGKQLASRNRLAGAGCKPPQAAGVKSLRS